jgi:hypothetical protein
MVEDLVAEWDPIIVENSAFAHGIPPDRVAGDTAIQNLRQLRFVGAWRQGDTIHFGLSLMPVPTEDLLRRHPGVAPQAPAQLLAKEYGRRMLAARDTSALRTMDPETYCLYGGLNEFFVVVEIETLHGNAFIVADRPE